MLIQRRPRKGTKKYRSRSLSARERRSESPLYSGRDHRSESPIYSRMGNLSDSDDSDISSVSQSRRRSSARKPRKQNLKTVCIRMFCSKSFCLLPFFHYVMCYVSSSLFQHTLLYKECCVGAGTK